MPARKKSETGSGAKKAKVTPGSTSPPATAANSMQSIDFSVVDDKYYTRDNPSKVVNVMKPEYDIKHMVKPSAIVVHTTMLKLHIALAGQVIDEAVSVPRGTVSRVELIRMICALVHKHAAHLEDSDKPRKWVLSAVNYNKKLSQWDVVIKS